MHTHESSDKLCHDIDPSQQKPEQPTTGGGEIARARPGRGLRRRCENPSASAGEGRRQGRRIIFVVSAIIVVIIVVTVIIVVGKRSRTTKQQTKQPLATSFLDKGALSSSGPPLVRTCIRKV